MYRIKIITNANEVTKNLKKKIIELIKKYKFKIDDNNPDIIIVIGGDGTFIKALKQTKYNPNLFYIGINTGHLGFMQDVDPSEIDKLFDKLKNGLYYLDKIYPIDITFKCNKRKFYYKAINEYVIREQNLKVIKTEVKLNNQHLEDFCGDGLMISSSSGSTAYNLSAGGAIVYPSLKSIQLTPLAPLPISSQYACLNNSIILPQHIAVELIPQSYYKDKIVSSIDGEKIILDNDINSIKISLCHYPIQVIRLEPYNFCEKINEKFLNK